MENIDKTINGIREPRVDLSKMFNHNIDDYFDYLKKYEEEEKKKGKYKFLEEPSEIQERKVA